jgi:cytochrome c-type biogenesis protein CcmH/NrfG
MQTMALDLAKLRKLLSLDPNDPLSRFALGKKLFETESTPESLEEAAEHLRFANAKAPEHLATYHVLGQVLMKLGRADEARAVLEAGISRVAGVGEGMGRDLGPAMRELLQSL